MSKRLTWRAIARVLPWAGSTTSGLLLVAWHCAWVPFVNVADLRWLKGHSEDEICAEIERAVNVAGWSHDVELAVGNCGPEWFGRILHEMKQPRPDVSRCRHFGDSLRMLTGQSFADDDIAAWEGWYETNRHLSQDVWYRQAFHGAGLDLPLTLEEEDAHGLLNWMGQQREEEPGAYAAYKLLRGQHVLGKLDLPAPTRSLSPTEARGLQLFATWAAHDVRAESPVIASPNWRFWPPVILWCIAVVSAFLSGLSIRRARPLSGSSVGEEAGDR